MNDWPSDKPVAIAGAGIAGLGAAIALRLAGVPVLIFEREAALQPAGAGIQLGPNATRILEEWRVDISRSACEPEAIELKSAKSGRTLNLLPLSEARRRYDAPYLTMHRADLQAALLARVEGLGCAIRYGCPIENVRAEESGVVVEAGGEEFKAAALIGADGVRSAVRRLLGSPEEPSYSHMIAWRALLDPTLFPAPFRAQVTLWMGPHAHLVAYPVCAAKLMNAVLVMEDDGKLATEGPQHGAFLIGCIAGWTGLARAVIAASDWQPWPLYRMGKNSGGAGRVQLIGDAWHAMLPFLASGGVMAIEDAETLSTAFEKSGGNVVRALDDFREMRGARVWRVAAASEQMGRIYHLDSPFDRFRDMSIAMRSGEALLQSNDWLYSA